MAASCDVSVIAVNVAAIVRNFVEEHDLGLVSGAGAGFRSSRDPDRLYLSDAAFVRTARLPPGGVTDPFEGAPDLAVEVKSSSTSAADLDRKMRSYLETGTALGWVIDPVARTVGVSRPGKPVDVLRESDIRNGGEVLPGLRMPIARILRIGSGRALDET